MCDTNQEKHLSLIRSDSKNTSQLSIIKIILKFAKFTRISILKNHGNRKSRYIIKNVRKK